MDNLSISLGKRQLVDSIWKSAGIEGLGTTFPNTEKILENLPVQTKRDEVLFILNMKHAWEFLFENIEYPENLLCLREINKICMRDLSFDAGNIRRLPVTIGGTSWRPELPNEAAIIDELERISRNPDKLEAALDLFCFIARTQMFLDGNKRVAQLAANKILMRYDVGILSIPYDAIGTFKEELVRFYETGDSSKLKTFFKAQCLLLNPDVHRKKEQGA